jgi:uncharacterized protein (TIRG00374 family)
VTKNNQLTKTVNWKLWIGLLLSALFLYLAFRKVDFDQMWNALKKANYWYLPPAILVLFFSHYLRALRWRYLLDPIRRLDTGSLFLSLIIGYGANTVTPAHLGEVLRAYVLSKKREISMSSVFATVVVERIIDVFTLLLLMCLVIFIHPFPGWVLKSGYIMFAGTLGLFLLLVFLKKSDSKGQALLRILLKPLPERYEARMKGMIERFLSGVVRLRRWHDYVAVTILSAPIWVCYALGFYFGLRAFDFISTYQLAWYVSLVLLVITTISVVVPSSPGYVGTFHFLCRVSLAMFGVPASSAFSFAIVVHAVMFLPVLALAILFASYEGIRIYKPDVGPTEELEPQTRPPRPSASPAWLEGRPESKPPRDPPASA